MIGPSMVFGFPDSPYLVGSGQVLCGVTMAVLNVLALPEMLRHANLAFPNNEEVVSNYCSGIFNSSLGIGQITGPLFGSNVTASMGVNGFRYTQDIAALIALCYSILYFSMCNGPEACSTMSAKSRRQFKLQ